MSNNFYLLTPEFMVVGLAFLVLTADFILKEDKKYIIPLIAVLGLVGILVFTFIYQIDRVDDLFQGMIRIDGYSLFFKAFFLVLGVVMVLSSVEYVNRHLGNIGEYYGILIFTIVAMMLMAASGELLTAYICLELLSFGLYVLVSFDRYGPKSNEGGTKYILLGAFSSAIMLYGISQIYGLLGTTRFDEIATVLNSSSELSLGVLIGLVFLIGGLGFKIAAVPFHMWAPDAYEGAPIPITAYLAVGSKAAAFALLIRFFVEALIPAVADWQLIIILLSALTMTIGNLIALTQKNLKRLLAYSSIGHVGYLLVGIASLASIGEDGGVDTQLGHLASNGIILHLVAYGITNMAAFLGITTLYNATGKDDIKDLVGLSRRAPFLALVIGSSFFSLAGLPVFAGFVSKFYLFTAAASQGLLWLAGLAIFTSLISLYYYLNVVRQLFIEDDKSLGIVRVPRMTTAVLAILFIGVVLLGIYPSPLIDAIQHASDAIWVPSIGGLS